MLTLVDSGLLKCILNILERSERPSQVEVAQELKTSSFKGVVVGYQYLPNDREEWENCSYDWYTECKKLHGISTRRLFAVED